MPVHLENSEDSHCLLQFQVPNVLPACLAWLWPHPWSAAQDAELARSKHIWHLCIWRILRIPIFFHNFRLQMGCLPACLSAYDPHPWSAAAWATKLARSRHNDMSAIEEFWRIPNSLLQFQAIIECGVMLVGTLVENQQAAHGTSKGKLLRREWSVGEICKWRKKKVRVGSGYRW